MTPQGVAAGEVWFPDVVPAGDWVGRAACRGRVGDLWFPDPGDRATHRAAVAVCEGCPVRRECLDYAQVNVIRFGIWGGLSDRDRQRLRGPASRKSRRLPPGHGDPGRWRYGCRCDQCREAHRAEVAGYRETAKVRRQAGHVQVHDWAWLVFLLLFIILGLRILQVVG